MIKMIRNGENRRTMAFVLAASLILGICPGTGSAAATGKADAGTSTGGIAVKTVTEDAAPEPTETPMANQLLSDIDNLLAIRFDEIATFDSKLTNIKQKYGITNDNMSSNEHVQAAQALEEKEANSRVTALSNVVSLLNEIDEAKAAITQFVTISLSESTYDKFCAAYNTAKEKLNTYYSDFSYYQNMEIFKGCLYIASDVTVNATIRDKRIDNLNTYKIFEKRYNIETAYHYTLDIITSNGAILFTDTNSGYMDDFITVVNNNATDSSGSSILYLLYNGNEIRNLITQYNHVNNFRSALKAVVSKGVPGTKEEIEELTRARNLYEALTDDEKAKVPSSDVTSLTNLGSSVNELSNVASLISVINYPTNDSTYATFKDAYDTAYAAYTGLVAKYGSTSGVDRLVTGIDEFLGDMTTVKNILAKIETVLKTEDNQMLNNYGSIQAIVTLYRGLSTANQNRIYSYATFYTVYQDATAAWNLRLEVDALLIAMTSNDQTKIESIRTRYNAMNAKAKAYFGNLYLQHLSELEYGTYAKSLAQANRVVELISYIGVVTANSRTRIEEAEAAYSTLTDYQKQLVSNYGTLVAARTAYNNIRNDLSAARVTNIKTGYVYTHSAIKPQPIVRVDGNVLMKGVDYTVSYSNNKNVGTGKVTIKAIDGSGYRGTFTKTFAIVKDSVKDGTISGIKKKYKYTGYAIKPSAKVVVNGFTLKKGTDYTITYSNNKTRGTATLKIKGKGNYKGTKTKTFKIVK